MKAKKPLFQTPASIGDLCRASREALDNGLSTDQVVPVEQASPATESAAPQSEDEKAQWRKQRHLLWIKLKAQLEGLSD